MQHLFRIFLLNPVQWLYIILLYGVLTITVLLYLPGLNGPFLFDDYANLNALGDYNGVRNWTTFKHFVFGNQSGPTGRPISMASFLLNDINWPSNPHSFKTTNLSIHLLNGLLLFWVVTKLLLISKFKKHLCYWAALLVTSYWILHPLNISTVLYPVQRMTQFATFFVLIGLNGYIHGRNILQKNTPVAAYWWMSLSIVFGTLLATFSKENGALLPLLALTIEKTQLKKLTRQPDWQWQLLFLWLPLFVLIIYFVNGSYLEGYEHRNFSLKERLLTQPRILFNYLYFWFIPQVNSPGILTQDFELSSGFIKPITTLYSLISLLIILAGAIIVRTRFPILSMSVLFYFVGHLLESSFIPLELYFEHRNYLPALFLATPLATGILKLRNLHPKWLLVGIFLIIIPAILTFQRIQIWSDKESLAYHWANKHPNSQRAQRFAAITAYNVKKYKLSLNILDRAKTKLPNRISIYLHWLTLKCQFHNITPIEKSTTKLLLENGYFSLGSYELLLATIKIIPNNSCLGGDMAFAFDIIRALEKNKIAIESKSIKHILHHFRGLLHIRNSDYQSALISFQLAQQQQQLAQSGLFQIALLATHGKHDLALTHLDSIHRFINKTPRTRKIYFSSELSTLKKQILLEKDVFSKKLTKRLSENRNRNEENPF